MHPLIRKFFGMNWLLLLMMFVLAVAGIYSIHSASYFREPVFYRNQILWLSIGAPIFFVLSLIDYRWIRWGAIPLYLGSVVLLVAVRFIGVERYGSESWIDLGPISIQPSQFALIFGILILSLFLSQFRRLPAILRIIGCGIIAGIPCILIIVQPDLGATIVWGPVIFCMLFVAGIPKRYLIVMILLVVIAIPLAVNFGLKAYQRDRIVAFVDPDIDPLGVSWTINQSLIAIGSGGMTGKGLHEENTQNKLGFLPSTIVHNDFIFSAMAEQHGFIGGVALISLFAITLMTGLYIAFYAEDDLGRLLASGIVMMMFTYVFMNIGMTISITPITGLPLPLISYGGTFALVIMIGFALLQSIWIHRRTAA